MIGFVKRRPQREHLVQHQTQSVDVTPAVGLARHLFRRHVAQRTDDFARSREPVALEQFCQAEIGDPNRACLVEDQVGRLDIAVQNFLTVSVGQSRCDLAADSRYVDPVAATGMSQAGIVSQQRGVGDRTIALKPNRIRFGRLTAVAERRLHDAFAGEQTAGDAGQRLGLQR